LESIPVPEEFLKPTGSPRDPYIGVPATVFRYDLVWEFISAIVEQRDAVPSFLDGLRAQIVADSVLDSFETGRWVEVQEPALSF
jgi:predicted dehydrogenase